MFDTRCTGNIWNTRSKNIHAFLDRYIGIDFFEEMGMHYA